MTDLALAAWVSGLIELSKVRGALDTKAYGSLVQSSSFRSQLTTEPAILVRMSVSRRWFANSGKSSGRRMSTSVC
jgi:hypothetical protein